MKINLKTALIAVCLVSSALVFFKSGAARAEEVSKQDWIEYMKSALPAALCDSKQYFRQCYSISAVECEDAAASATRLCLQNNESKIPDTMTLPDDGVKWGSEIGKCAGSTYDVVLVKKKINSDLCNNAENWIPKN